VTTRVSRYQKGKTRKGKTNLDLLQQEIVSGSGICWPICKSAPHRRQPCQHPTTQFFTGRMPFLTPNQQRQSTECIISSIRQLYSKTVWELGHDFMSEHHVLYKNTTATPYKCCHLVTGVKLHLHITALLYTKQPAQCAPSSLPCCTQMWTLSKLSPTNDHDQLINRQWSSVELS